MAERDEWVESERFDVLALLPQEERFPPSKEAISLPTFFFVVCLAIDVLFVLIVSFVPWSLVVRQDTDAKRFMQEQRDSVLLTFSVPP